MKKALILATAMCLVLTGSLFAAGNRHLVAEPNATFIPGTAPFGTGVLAAAGPTTTNNDDTCDISTAPAATLLLPYFAANPTGLNTIFTITNTSNVPQIAHITLWTDWSFPVLDFNIFLTGYDVQPLSLRDIIFNGVIAPLPPPSTLAGTNDLGGTFGANPRSPRGSLSATTNPNFSTAGTNCSNLPGAIGPLATAVQNALISGTYVIPGVAGSCSASDQVGSAASSAAGSLHPAGTAVGYVTIDVANNCSLTLPTVASYYRQEILFDNVLTGDYQIFDSSQASNFAGGNPLVHIRAIPEGGPAGFTPAAGTAFTNLPYTFYGRYQVGQAFPPVVDRRQPLPSTFAARYIQGGGLSTSYRIWREGPAGAGGLPNTTCSGANAVVNNSQISIAEVVRFDEHENPSVFSASGQVSPSTPTGVFLPETATVPVTNVAGATQIFPNQPTTAGDLGGWMYLNLDVTRAGSAAQTATATLNPLFPGTTLFGVGGAARPLQNWVVVSFTASGPTAGAFAVDFDATWMANGCTPGAAQSPANGGTIPIRPGNAGTFGGPFPAVTQPPQNPNAAGAILTPNVNP